MWFHAKFARRCSSDPDVIGLQATESDHPLCTASLGFGQQVFQLSGFVTSQSRPDFVVAFHKNRSPQHFTQPGQRFKWRGVSRLTAGDAVAGDWLGTALAMNKDHVFVGAAGRDPTGEESGAVYLFAGPGR